MSLISDPESKTQFAKGVLSDKARGLYATETIYNDLDADQLETLARTQPHREVDLTVVEADKQGKSNSSCQVFQSDRLTLRQVT